MWRLRRAGVAALAGIALSACAYFNSLYNARQSYTEGRRAADRGDSAAAARSFASAIARAAASYRRDSTGRWSDDALELIGRSYFAVGDYGHARAAFARMLERGVRGDRRAAARAYLGAALARSDRPGEAIASLDSAAARLPPGTELGAFTRLWRARARFAANDGPGAWADLEAAAGAPGPLGVEARLEAIARAVSARDTTRAAAAFAAAFAGPGLAPRADSVHALVRAAAAAWGPARARRLLAPGAPPRWPAAQRLELALLGATLAEESGDTTTAIAEARSVARGPDRAVANRARVAVARWRLAAARDLPAADAVRGELLPAIADSQAQQLVRALGMLDILVGRAPRGEPIALFAAAELARDQLGAPELARRLFLAYADLVPGAPWAPKAIMAAALLVPPAAGDSLRARLRAYAASVYVRARVTADDDSAFADAETRLQRALAGASQLAAGEAARRDAGVTRAVAVLDSVRAAARTDSLRLACGAFVDSAGFAGARGDSLRAACIRRDSAKVALFLKADTMKRADSAAVRPVPTARRDPRAVTRDTST